MSAPVARPWVGALVGPADGPAVEVFLSALADVMDPAGDGIDNTNIKAGANIDGAKFADLSILNSKIAAATLTYDKLAANTLTDDRLLWASTSGVRALRTAGAAQRKIVHGKIDLVIANGTASKTGSIVFATDGVDTATAFATATDLVVVLSTKHSSALAIMAEMTGSPSTTGVAIRVFTATGGNVGADTTVTIHFYAVGRTA